MWYKFCCGCVSFVLRAVFGLKIRVYGKEHLPRRGGFILVSNHTSNLDPMLLGIACFRKLNYMAKEALFRNPVGGWLLRSVGAFPVRRGTADLSAIREAFNRVKRGGGLLLFPQGGRRPADDTSDPEPGVGMLSQRMGVPVIPAYISGTDKALPPGSSRIVAGSGVTVRFGPAITVDADGKYQETASSIMRAVRSLAHA